MNELLKLVQAQEEVRIVAERLVDQVREFDESSRGNTGAKLAPSACEQTRHGKASGIKEVKVCDKNSRSSDLDTGL